MFYDDNKTFKCNICGKIHFQNEMEIVGVKLNNYTQIIRFAKKCLINALADCTNLNKSDLYFIVAVAEQYNKDIEEKEILSKKGKQLHKKLSGNESPDIKEPEKKDHI